MQFSGEGLRERIRWSGCGLLAGLLMGMILGWMFHGLIGTAIKVAIIFLFLLPLAAAVYFWLSTRSGGSNRDGSIREANWRDLGGRRGPDQT